MWISENIARCSHKEDGDHHSHAGRQAGVHAGGSLNPLNIQSGKNQREEDSPYSVRHSGSEHVRLLADPDDADHGIEHVVHDHAPPRHVAEGGINFLTNISKRGARAGIGARHTAITDRGE